jgi:SAM-dependent methyltransferase
MNTPVTALAADAAGHALAQTTHWIVSVVQPPGYAHSGALMEVAETLLYALRRLGRKADLGMFDVSQDGLVVLGAHLLPASYELPPQAVLYNLEQLASVEQGEGGWAPDLIQGYLNRLMRHRVWDYSQANIDWLRQRGHQRVKWLPVGYVPELSRVPMRGAQDVDVLFYGSRSPRRVHILDALRARGLRVQGLIGVYGQERDAWIGRAKVVLNMHHYSAQLFEIARVSYLLTNRKAVVCEDSVMSADDAPLREGMAYVPYDGLVDTCEALVRDDARRAQLERRGHDLFSRRDATRLLAELLGLPTTKPEPDTAAAALPDVLRLGDGQDLRADCFNVDIHPSGQSDLALDFGAPLLWNQPLATARFGEVRLEENQFEQIIANDVLQRIPNQVQAMTNALRLLKPGGVLSISVPYDPSVDGAPATAQARGFNEKSWRYYTDWFSYLGWSEARFDLVRSDVTLSRLGQQLAARGQDMSAIIRTPGGIDSMQVALRKRYLTNVELLTVQQKRALAKHRH